MCLLRSRRTNHPILSLYPPVYACARPAIRTVRSIGWAAVDIFKVKYQNTIWECASCVADAPHSPSPRSHLRCVRACAPPAIRLMRVPFHLSLSLSLSLVCVAVLPFARWHSQTRHHHPDDEDAPPPPPPPPPPLPRSTSQPAWLQDPVRTENSRGGGGGGTLVYLRRAGSPPKLAFFVVVSKRGCRLRCLAHKGGGAVAVPDPACAGRVLESAHISPLLPQSSTETR